MEQIQIQIQRGYFRAQKIGLLLQVFLMIAVTIFIMSMVRLSEGDYHQFIADILFLLVVILGYIKLRKDHSSYKKIARIVFFSALTASLFLLRNHPDTPVRFIWFSTVVYMIYYLFDKKESLYWLGSIVLILLVLFLVTSKFFY